MNAQEPARAAQPGRLARSETSRWKPGSNCLDPRQAQANPGSSPPPHPRGSVPLPNLPVIHHPGQPFEGGRGRPAALSLERNRATWLAKCVVLISLCLVPAALWAREKVEYAKEFRAQLIQKIMPYWYDSAIDYQYGGYLLSDDAARKAPPATEKQIVSQARMIWGFSQAHRKGLEDGRRDYLKAAEQGYRFLQDHFLDRQNGGYFWTTDLAGKPLNERKIVYGESFVIYGLVEYYRASGDKAALQQALDLYKVLQKHSHDSKYGGWIEHFQRDWTPLLSPGPELIVEVGGFKSANTHLHLLEAFTELYEATHDASVKESLAEAVKLNATYFYPADAGQSCFHRHLDWTPVSETSSAGLSYGHNVEFAWLMIRAEQVLGRQPSWAHFEAHLDHALKYGYDHQRGGLYSRGMDNQPADNLDKVWWVEAELLAALTDSLKHKPDAARSEALDKLLGFVVSFQANPADGIWLDTVAADGTPKVSAKAHNWKANYHDVRALVKFIEAFGAARTAN
jgi:mannobiose 2-epimerase